VGRILAGISTRKYRRVQEPVGEQTTVRERSTSKSSVSRAFVQRTREALWHLMSRQLADLRLAVVMLDGIEIKGRTNVVALGITTDSDKLALGLWSGSTENATATSALLSDLASRGLDVDQGMLFVIDGSKALRKAIRQVFGDDVPVQRCVRHKERNVLELLPERDRQPTKRRLVQAWQETDHAAALDQLRRLAVELDHEHPRAAASLREGVYARDLLIVAIAELDVFTRLAQQGPIAFEGLCEFSGRQASCRLPSALPQRARVTLGEAPVLTLLVRGSVTSRSPTSCWSADSVLDRVEHIDAGLGVAVRGEASVRI
jgi:transposase-like protein